MEEKRKIPPQLEMKIKAKEAESKINPIDIVGFITTISNRINDCQQQVDEKNKYIQELCDSWQPEHLNEYLRAIEEIQIQYKELWRFAETGQHSLFDWHCW